MSDFNNIATFRLADASKIDNLPANTNSELAGKAAASHTHDDIYYTETETNFLLNGKQSVSEKGQPSGYASLDGTGKVPASQLPATVVDGDMSKSTYDTNDNGIVDNSEKLGGQLPSYYLDVDNHTDGTTNKVYTTTEKTKLAGIEAGAEVNTINSVVAGTNIFIDNTDPLNPIINASGGEGGGAVDSVNGQTGVVVLDTDDIAEGTTNKYLSATDKADLTDGGDTELHTHDGRYYTETETNNLLNAKANDNEVVKLTGNQTIAGVKTFSSSPIVPTPTADMEVATKKYVDDNAGGGSSTQSTFVAGEDITTGNALRNGNASAITYLVNITQDVGGYTTNTHIGKTTDDFERGESFILASSSIINNCSIYLAKVGSPDTVINLEIFSDAGFTTLVGTSTNSIASNTLTTSLVKTTFNFSGLILNAGTYYLKINIVSGNLNNSNYAFTEFSTTNVYAGTIYKISTTGAVVANNPSSIYDLRFILNDGYSNTTYYEDISKVYKTDASNSSKLNFIGFATNTATTGGNVTVDTCGINNNQSSLVIGSTYYLSDTAGAISTTPGTNVVQVGKSISTTGIEINNNFVNNDTIIISLQQNFATTTVINHNLGRIPEKIEFQHISAISNLQHSKGIYKNGTNKCIYYYTGTSPYAYSDNTKCCKDGYGFTAYVSAVTSTTFTLVNTANSGSSSYLQIIATLS